MCGRLPPVRPPGRAWRTGGRGGWKPFLYHVTKGEPYCGRAIALKVPKKLPRILTVAEEQAILDACTRLRDRGWTVDQLPDGTFTWTTPAGRTYTTEPTRYPI